MHALRNAATGERCHLLLEFDIGSPDDFPTILPIGVWMPGRYEEGEFYQIIRARKRIIVVRLVIFPSGFTIIPVPVVQLLLTADTLLSKWLAYADMCFQTVSDVLDAGEITPPFKDDGPLDVCIAFHCPFDDLEAIEIEFRPGPFVDCELLPLARTTTPDQIVEILKQRAAKQTR